MKPNTHKTQTLVLAIMLALLPFFGLAQEPNAKSWKILGPGGGGTTILASISPHDSRLVATASDMTGGYITRDNGQSWRMFNLHEEFNAIAFDPVDPLVIYACNAALWRSSDSGRTWKMLFPSPTRNTIQHETGDRANYRLTSTDPAYPGGLITAFAITSENTQHGHRTKEHLYLSFQKEGQPAVVVFSQNGGASWSRLATLPQRILLLAPQGSNLIAVSGSASYRIAPDGSTTELGRIPTSIRAASTGRSGDSVWIYATGQDGNVYLSENSGQHWRAVTPALQQTSGRFEAVAASDRHPEVAYAGFRGLQIGEGKAEPVQRHRKDNRRRS
jgi:hypothetical protein